MEYEHLKQALQGISGKDLEQRTGWYSPADKAYHSTRPIHPVELVTGAVRATQLSQSPRLLELGCGLGTATGSFAELVGQMVCLAPNPDFHGMATATCSSYPSVDVIK
ncbi:hypothetical protein KBY84_02715 [Cyanobium sp. N.Huapi 1H5]|uniref:hypothetical protein n=1 Tax=Cyanobium sp. N.Huapi 1H5 TaxID=2823719 RepID=UPI0020CFC45E|nr:hypothetical protein [Cyanobium sp. N.Huapi 1H5]MCP9836406.1 hypothetical protein [Cyanobium sp. N.Huapi 1H5]